MQLLDVYAEEIGVVVKIPKRDLENLLDFLDRCEFKKGDDERGKELEKWMTEFFPVINEWGRMLEEQEHGARPNSP